jgi:hypothetical protein
VANEPITIFACRRQSDRPSCKVCHRRTDGACSYPLRGRLEGKTCDTPLCSAHQHGEHGYCEAHHRMAERTKTTP